MLFRKILIFTFIELLNYKDGGGYKKKNSLCTKTLEIKKWLSCGYSKITLIFPLRVEYTSRKRVWIQTNSGQRRIYVKEKSVNHFSI